MFPQTVHCISVQAYDRYYFGPRTYLIQSLFYPLHHIHPSPAPQIGDLATEITFLISNLHRKTQMACFSSSPITGLEWPRGFQEVKVPRFHDNGTGWW